MISLFGANTTQIVEQKTHQKTYFRSLCNNKEFYYSLNITFPFGVEGTHFVGKQWWKFTFLGHSPINMYLVFLTLIQAFYNVKQLLHKMGVKK